MEQLYKCVPGDERHILVGVGPFNCKLLPTSDSDT